MQGYLPLKMKRKDLEEVNDEFSDFSLSSPARKIRRLDAELPPIMEEEESDIPPMVFEQSMPGENLNFSSDAGQKGFEEILPVVAENDERAIVLFKPINTPLFQSPSGFSVSVNPDIISGFKNQFLWSGQSSPLKTSEDEVERWERNYAVTNESLAVVPWVPSQHPPTLGVEAPQTDASELMEAEEIEAAAMDIEDNHVGIEEMSGNDFGGTTVSEGLHQWQQHCMTPQPPQNASTPIIWFR